MLTLLRKQARKERLTKSFKIWHKLKTMRGFKKAKTILFYASFDGEVETFEMIKKALKLGKKIALPKTFKDRKKFFPVLVRSLRRDLETGVYGVREPKTTKNNVLDIKDIDMVVVPALAFDKANYRLGRGKGYYDRFLKQLPPKTLTVGLAFDFQMVDTIPHIKEHDVPTSCVLAN